MKTEIDLAFDELRITFESLDKNSVLKRVDWQDFMYMGFDSKKGHSFKHCRTRNYIYLSNRTIMVPVSGNSFHRGTF